MALSPKRRRNTKNQPPRYTKILKKLEIKNEPFFLSLCEHTRNYKWLRKGRRKKTCKILLSGKSFVHLNKTLTNSAVNSNLFPQSFILLVGHHLHVHSSSGAGASINVDPLKIRRVIVIGLLLIIPFHHLFCQNFSLFCSLCE